MNQRVTASVAIVLLACPIAPSAHAAVPRVIFSNIQSSPTSDVPGMPGFKFATNLQTQQGPAFQRPFGSPNGDRWVFRAWIREIATGFGSRTVLRGSGIDDSAAGVVMQVGTPTFFDSEVTYSSLEIEMDVGDNGSFVFSCDTTASEDSDEIVARWTPDGGYELMAREGVQAVAQPPGVMYSAGRGAQLLGDGRVAFASTLVGGSGSADFLNSAIDEGVILVQTGVTIPEDQTVPGTPLDSVGSVEIDAIGETYYYTGRLTNGHDIVAVNNVVVAERDRPLPGGYPGFFYDPDRGDDGGCVSPYNRHYTFRNLADLGAGPFDDVVIVDNRVVTVTGQPIVPGSTEVFSDQLHGYTFFMNLVNSDGDYLVGGWTRAGAVDKLAWVLNGRTVVARNGTPVDVTGDGQPDSGFTLSSIDFDAGFLTDDGRFFFTGTFRPPNLGSGFLWVRVPKRADPNCDGRIDFFDVDPYLLALFDEAGYAVAYPDCWRITADINRDGNIDFFDIDPFLQCLFTGCPPTGN